MIHFISVTIKNFRSYRDVTVDFRDDHGVYIFSGDNGAGKSTFLNAINWCLYGDTPFFSVGENRDVVSINADDNDKTEVTLLVEINDCKYLFSRWTNKNSAPSGVQSVQVVDDVNSGNWRDLSGVDARDAVMRFVPKDIRQLFFFNGEQLKDIYSGDGSLKANVYRVSELDIIDNAIDHLESVSNSFLAQIKKDSRNRDKIDALEGDIEQHKSGIVGCEELLAEYDSKISENNAKLNDLNKFINDSSEARRALEDEAKTKSELQETKSDIQALILNQTESFINNFHLALLYDDFKKYRDKLTEARDNNLIPPPVSPKITQEILESGLCICGRKITDEERAYITKQHEEYTRRSELQFLTDGIYEFRNIKNHLNQAIYDYKDLLNKISDGKAKQNELGQKLKKLQDQLELIDRGKLVDNPEVKRTHLENQIERCRTLRVNAANMKITHQEALKAAERELSKLSKNDAVTAALESQRLYAERLIQDLRETKEKMEKIIRQNLAAKIWSSFSAILPNTAFTGVFISENYSIIMESSNGNRYTIEMLSTGQAKVLGLSLVNALSVDLGYEEVPLLIDNLYGDIDAEHYRDVSNMIAALSAKKQAIIMNLISLNVDNTFNPEVVAGEFNIIRDGETSVIKETN